MKPFAVIPSVVSLSVLLIASPAMSAVSVDNILDNYANIALATFEDSLSTAQEMQDKIHAMVASPSDQTLASARAAWVAARVPYQQTEAYRFGNAIVDDWEGRVNAWPLDEGLIDYVNTEYYGEESDENPFFNANVIANSNLEIGGQSIDASDITPSLLSESLHEVDEVEANVASGYHAIEFLLWGQDLNGTEKGAGNRPATDFDTQNCTGGNCDRRVQYLTAATALLISDLEEMVANWKADGAARKDLMDKGEKGGLATILIGMGSLSYGELAGERTKLGLMLHDPEEEHDCFSDNTHFSHYYDAKSIKNVYLGEYTRVNGDKVSGDSLSGLLAEKAPEVDSQLQAELEATESAMQAMVDAAAEGNTFDVLIASGNAHGNSLVQAAVDALTTQTKSIEKAIKALGLADIELEGSDSLDNPTAVIDG